MWIECRDICRKIRKKVFVHPFGFWLILALPRLRILQEVREMIRNNLFCWWYNIQLRFIHTSRRGSLRKCPQDPFECLNWAMRSRFHSGVIEAKSKYWILTHTFTLFLFLFVQLIWSFHRISHDGYIIVHLLSIYFREPSIRNHGKQASTSGAFPVKRVFK